MEDIIALFKKHDKNVFVEEIHNGEFDYLIRFSEENEDPYYYCFHEDVYKRQLLRTMITYKALNAGIRIIEQEESYTSKADLIANDRIPTYGVDDKDASFSGKRIKRGLYRCSNGMILNADCHAAANIMRKAIPDIWKDTRDYTFLSAPDVYGFHKLNPKGIPVKGDVYKRQV